MTVNDGNKPKPKEVIAAITGRPYGKDLTPHLKRMFASSKKRQIEKGVLWELTFEEYLGLISKARRMVMQRELNKGTLKRFMESTRGYVLTPKGRSEKAAMVCNAETFEFVNREKSRRNQHMKKGDKHREDTKQQIADKRRGTFQSDETREKIRIGNIGKTRSEEQRAAMSAGQKGKPKSPEQRAKMKAAAQARWAAKRAEQEAHAYG